MSAYQDVRLPRRVFEAKDVPGLARLGAVNNDFEKQLQSSPATDHSQIYCACKLVWFSSSWGKVAVVKLLLGDPSVGRYEGFRAHSQQETSRGPYRHRQSSDIGAVWSGYWGHHTNPFLGTGTTGMGMQTRRPSSEFSKDTSKSTPGFLWVLNIFLEYTERNRQSLRSSGSRRLLRFWSNMLAMRMSTYSRGRSTAFWARAPVWRSSHE